MKPLTLNFYADPGHGWLACKRSLVAELGLLRQITPYSYQRGGTVYLEEDCDASLVTQALRDKGIAFIFKEKHTDKTSPIRSYERYRYEN